MLQSIFLSSLLATLVTAQSSVVSKCRFGSGDLPLQADVQGCNQTPCVLHQRQYAILNLAFEAPHDIQALRTKAAGYITYGSSTWAFPVDLGSAADGCSTLIDARCPLQQDQLVKLQLPAYINERFPVGTVADIEVAIGDVSNEATVPVLCLNVRVRIAP